MRDFLLEKQEELKVIYLFSELLCLYIVYIKKLVCIVYIYY